MTAITPGALNHEGLEPLASRFVNVDNLFLLILQILHE